MASVIEVPAGSPGIRYYLTYTGVGIPFRLVNPLEEAQVPNRNTFIRAWFDSDERLIGFDKLVYGEVELAHRYAYHADGALARAEIMMCDEEPVVLEFDKAGSKAGAEVPVE